MDEDQITPLRAKCTDQQRRLLDKIWREAMEHNRPLARTVLIVEGDGTRVIAEALGSLGGSVVLETPDAGGGCTGYALTLVGALLTTQGSQIEQALTRFLEDVRSSVIREPRAPRNYHSTLTSEWGFNFDAVRMLACVFRMPRTPFNFGGSYNSAWWNITVSESVIETVIQLDNIDGFVRREVSKSYDPDCPLDSRERERYEANQARVRWSAREKPVVAYYVPTSASESVELLLHGAEALVRTNGPASAVDRMHTALQTFLGEHCKDEGLEPAPTASISALLKLLRDNHPAFLSDTVRRNDITRVLNGLGQVASVMDPIRNNASAAHPTDEMLALPEAVLAITAMQAVMRYVDLRIQLYKDNFQ